MSTKHVAVLLVLVALSGGLADGGVMSDAYVFPVVVRAAGSADSFWNTELCINNPRAETLTVVLGLFQNGGVEGLAVIDLNGWEVMCSSDFLLNWFEFANWTGGVLIYAPEEDNAGLDSLYFSASVRVYNDLPGGTYGLNVEPEIDAGWYGGAYIGEPTRFGCASGLRNTGTPGVDGFRTSVGFFNTMGVGQTVTVMAYDSNGDVWWEKDLWVPAFTQIQKRVPNNISITIGGVDAHHDGDQWVLGYMTVTDNRSGDGLYRPLQVLYSGMQKSRSAKPLDGLIRAAERHRAAETQSE